MIQSSIEFNILLVLQVLLNQFFEHMDFVLLFHLLNGTLQNQNFCFSIPQLALNIALRAVQSLSNYAIVCLPQVVLV